MWESLWTGISDPASWGMVLTLVVLEGLLSADNALVLAIMVKHLPKKQQKKALLYGIWGAFAFRLIAVVIGTRLIKIWWLKILGGLYLIWLVIRHFKPKSADRTNAHEGKGFWSTVLAVELMDIAFSLDSILAALGVSEKIWVVYTGGIMGIITMRFVAGLFITLIEKLPELETTAYALIAIIGVKMIAGALGFHISNTVFFSILFTLLAGAFVLHYIKRMRLKRSSAN